MQVPSSALTIKEYPIRALLFFVRLFHSLNVHINLCDIFTLCPLFALFQDGVHSVFGLLGWVLILFQQSLHQTAHVGTFRLPAIPVDGSVLPEHVGQFLGQFDELIVRVEVLYRLWTGQGIIESGSTRKKLCTKTITKT